MKYTILHFSDVHFPAELSCRSFFDKRILGCCNSLLIRKGKYKLEYFRDAVPLFLEKKPDLFVFTGDAVSSADPREFQKALAAFQPLIDSGIPLLYVPGNHDLYVRDRYCRKAMEDFYAALNGGRSYSDSPWLYDAGPVRIAAIHCAKPLSWYFSCGMMSQQTGDFLRKQMETAGTTAPLLLAGHFPVITDHPLLDFRRKLYGAKIAAEGLENGKIALSLCGHVHQGYERVLPSGSLELCAGSLTKHGSYLEITYDTDAAAEKNFCVKRRSVL
ncbi:MAG: metallophosphoesterase [Lentisphaeria bacterium]|nr:metallophosphoesterase [Lentisphaeria bacterium]